MISTDRVMEKKLNIVILSGFLLFTLIFDVVEAAQVNLMFDVRFDRAYSYNGSPFTGMNTGDMSTLQISFNTEITGTYESVEPWGVGTARLYTYLATPVSVISPFAQYVPSNPFSNQIGNSFSAAGVTANERLPSDVWYEDLWFANQYSQFSQFSTDGIDVYRSKTNIHWNMTNHNYMLGDLYFFKENDIINVLDRSISDGITFSISEDAYIDYSDGSFFGYDLDGTATLRNYTIVSSVPIPPAILLFTSGLLGLISLQLRKNKMPSKKTLILSIC